MRIVLAIAVLAVIACGGAASQRPAVQARALERVLATLPDDVSLVAIADEQRMRSSELLAPYWSEIDAWLAGSSTPRCREAVPQRGVAVAAVRGREVIVWLPGVDAGAVRACLAQLVASPPAGWSATTRDDFTAIDTPDAHGGIAVTNDTLVGVFADHPIARDHVVAAMQPRATRTHPELQRLVGATNALAIWASGKLLAPLVRPDLAATLAIDLSDHAVAELRIQLATRQAAQSLLAETGAQLGELRERHLVDSIDARVEGTTLAATVMIEGETARELIATLRAGPTLPAAAAREIGAKPLFERVDRAALERVADRAIEILLEDPRIAALRVADRGAVRTQIVERLCRDLGGGCKPAAPVGRPLQPDELAAVREALDRALVQAGIAEPDRQTLAPVVHAVAATLRLP